MVHNLASLTVSAAEDSDMWVGRLAAAASELARTLVASASAVKSTAAVMDHSQFAYSSPNMCLSRRNL